MVLLVYFLVFYKTKSFLLKLSWFYGMLVVLFIHVGMISDRVLTGRFFSKYPYEREMSFQQMSNQLTVNENKIIFCRLG